MATKKCPVCGVSVKMENLERHIKNQHPKTTVEVDSLLSETERAQVERRRSSSRLGLTRSGRKTIVIIAVLVAAVLLLAVLATTIKPPGTQPGSTAPDFTLSTSTGGSVTLSQYRGTPVLLEFMNTLCPNCQNEAPILASLYQTYGTRVQFLSVDMAVIGEFPVNSATEINAFKSTYGTIWEYAIDTNNAVAKTYGVTGTPTSFIIDAKGVVQTTYVGTHSLNDFTNALQKVLG